MPLSNNRDSFKDIITIFKEGYKSPAKAFVLAKALNEWGKLGMSGLILIIISLIFLAIFFEFRQANVVKNQAVRHIASQLGETISFIDIGKRSLEKREELLTKLMQTAPREDGRPIEGVEAKLHLLSTLLESCRAARSTFIDAFSKGKNPLLNPEISDSFKETITEGAGTLSFPYERPSIITLQEENMAWENLCWLCEQEIKRTQTLLQSASN